MILQIRPKGYIGEAVLFTGEKENYELIQRWSKGKVYIRGTALMQEERVMEMWSVDREVRVRVGNYIIRDRDNNFHARTPADLEAQFDILHVLGDKSV